MTAPHVTGLYLGHDETCGDDGMDVLLTTWSDGGADFATRPGKGRTELSWGPPQQLDAAPGAPVVEVGR